MKGEIDYNELSKEGVDDWLSGKPITEINLGEDILEGTESTPPQDILKFQILNCRTRCFQYLDQFYLKKHYNNQNSPKIEALFKTAVMMLYHNIRSSLVKDDSTRNLKIEMLITATQIQYVIKGFEEIDLWLYEKKLTSFDSKPRVNPYSAEARNKVNGL